MGSSGRDITLLDFLSLPYFYRITEILQLFLDFKLDTEIKDSTDVCGDDWRENIDADIKSHFDMGKYTVKVEGLVKFIKDFHQASKEEFWFGPLGRGFDDNETFAQYLKTELIDTFPKLLPCIWDHKFHRDSKWFRMKRHVPLPQVFQMLESGLQTERNRGALTRYTCMNGPDMVQIEVFDIDPYLSLYNKRLGSVMKIEPKKVIRIHSGQELKYNGVTKSKVILCVCVGLECLTTLPKCDRMVVFLSTRDHEMFWHNPGTFLELKEIPYTNDELSESARRKVKTYLNSTKQGYGILTGKVQRQILATASVGKLTTGDLGIQDILKLPQFSSSDTILKFLRSVANSRNLEKQIRIGQEATGVADWRHVLGTDFNDFSYRGPEYSHRTVSLVGLIRDVHEHMDNKWKEGNAVATIFPDQTYADANITRFVQYFVGGFPNLVPYLWAVKEEDKKLDWFDWSYWNVTGQLISGIFRALDEEADHGNINRMKYTSGGSSASLGEIEVDSLVYDQHFGKLVTIMENGDVTVQGWEMFVWKGRNIKTDRIVVLVADSSGRIDKEPNPIEWKDISEKRRTVIIDQGIIEVHGKTYKLQGIEHICQWLEGEQLNKLLKTKRLQLWERKKSSYMSRCVEVDKAGESLLANKTELCFTANGDDGVVLQLVKELLPPESNLDRMQFYRLPAFPEFCDGDNTRYVKLDAHQKKLSWYILEEEFVDQTESVKLAFVAANAGEGKSSMLSYLAESISLPDTVVIKTTAKNLLRDYYRSGESQLVKIVAACLAKSRFETALIVDTHMKILLLLDAVDEIDEDDMDNFYAMLNELEKIDKLRTILTVRSYLVAEIQERFPTAWLGFLCKLGPIRSNRLITSIWMKKFQGQIMDLEGIVDYLFFGGKFRSLKLTPLLCVLLADIYSNILQEGENFVDHIKDDTEVDIYAEVVEKYYERYLVEKKMVPKENSNQDYYRVNKKAYMDAHVLLAMEEVCPRFHKKCGVKYLKSDMELTPGQGFLENTKPVKFTHRPIADFFVDWWVLKVLQGEVTLRANHHKDFVSFFANRYVNTSEIKSSLNFMLRGEANIQFKFSIEELNVFKITSKYKKASWMCRVLLKACYVDSPEKFWETVLNCEDKFARKKLSELLLEASASNGYFEYFQQLYTQRKTFSLESSLDNSLDLLKRVVSYSSTMQDPLTTDSKLKIIDVIVEHEPEVVNVVDFFGNSVLMESGIAFDLYKRLVENKAKILGCSTYQVVTEVNFERQNILHDYSTDDEFLKSFVENYPIEYYECANATRCLFNQPMSSPFESVVITNSVLHCIDFCIKSSTGQVYHNLSNTLKTNSHFWSVACAGLQKGYKNPYTENLYEQLIFISGLEEPDMCRYIAEELIETNCSLFDFYRDCAEKEKVDKKTMYDLALTFPKNENKLSPYYAALYVKDCFHPNAPVKVEIGSGTETSFPSFLINTVLKTGGIFFENGTCCYLLNEAIADIVDDVDFIVPVEYSSQMAVNDSPFIVACKTAHVNIAKILFKSFSMEWMANLSEFEVMCLFRALEQHCGEFLDVFVSKLREENYIIPIRPVRDALASGNLKLFKCYFNSLGFNETRLAELAEINGFGLLHYVLENSKSHSNVIIENKHKLIAFILSLFPEALEACDNRGRAPMLVDRPNFNLVRHLIKKGANASATDCNGRSVVEIYVDQWSQSRHEPHLDIYDIICYLANVVGSTEMERLQKLGKLDEIGRPYTSPKPVPIRWLPLFKRRASAESTDIYL